MNNKNCAVILAAGQGKRMKSDLPKVMCQVLGRPMLDYVIDAAKKSVDDVCVIVGHKAQVIIDHLGGSCRTVMQRELLGTGHAVQQASDFIKEHADGNVLVICGDNPLMDAQTIDGALRQHIEQGNAITVITACLDDPAVYGRIVKRNGSIAAIVEYKDADEETRAINEINSGAYWFKADMLLSLLSQLDCDNAQNEYYLTDTIKLAIKAGEPVNSYVAQRQDVVMGANDPAQLAELNERAKLYFQVK